MRYEYHVVPAPTKTERDKNAKTVSQRLAATMTKLVNEMAQEGWEYVRAETLSVTDKPGRFSKRVETIETVFVFRRPVDNEKPPVGERKAFFRSGKAATPPKEPTLTR